MGRGAQQLRLLIVDDVAAFARALRFALSELSFTCAVATSFDDAIEAVRMNSFEVVLSDLELAGRSGFDLLARVRERSPETTTIIMTGSVHLAPSAFRRPYVDAHIFKPFELDMLCRLIFAARSHSSGVRPATPMPGDGLLAPISKKR